MSGFDEMPPPPAAAPWRRPLGGAPWRRRQGSSTPIFLHILGRAHHFKLAIPTKDKQENTLLNSSSRRPPALSSRHTRPHTTTTYLLEMALHNAPILAFVVPNDIFKAMCEPLAAAAAAAAAADPFAVGAPPAANWGHYNPLPAVAALDEDALISDPRLVKREPTHFFNEDVVNDEPLGADTPLGAAPPLAADTPLAADIALAAAAASNDGDVSLADGVFADADADEERERRSRSPEPEELAPAPDSPCDCAPCGKRTCGYCWKRRFVCMSCGAVHKRMRLAAL